jgi:hypothetical protein
MSELCKVTPLPIALDEELIGVFSYKDKGSFITKNKTTIYHLKPSFIGGFRCKKNGSHLLKVSNRLGGLPQL